MWFKNIQIYRFTEDFTISEQKMADAFDAHTFSPLGQMQEQSTGWVAPFKDSDMLVETVSGRLFMSLQTQEKILPASVINEHLAEKVESIELDEGRRPTKKERDQLKEDLRAQLLPKAFHKTRRLSAFMDLKKGYLVVNASSDKSADDFTSFLRESIGSLPIAPLGAKISGADLLTEWFIDATKRPHNTLIEADLELVMVQDPTVKARYKNLDLEAPEIQHSLEGGMRIRQMSMTLEDKFQFAINEKCQLKRLKYQDGLIEQAQDSDDPRTDAIMMSHALIEWIETLATYTEIDAI